MFEYQRDYFEKLRGQHIKFILNLVLFSIFLGVLFLLAGGIAAIIIAGSVSTIDATGSNALSILGVIFSIIFFLLFAIFVLIPLNFSYYNYYFLAYEENISRFKHGLFPLQKGKYLKSLGLAIVLILIGFAMNIFVNIVTGPIFYGGGFGFTDVDNCSIVAVNCLGEILLLFIGLIVTEFLSILVQGCVANTCCRHLEKAQNTFGDKVSTGFNIISKNFKQFLKLVISMFLLSLILILIVGVSILLASVIIAFTNSTALSVLVGILAGLVILIASIFISYISYGGFISFYKKNMNYPEETVEYIEA